MAGKRAPWSPERKAAWKAQMASRNNKPASGMPASGPGWGGEAKGSGNRKAAAPKITSKTAAEMAQLPRDYNRIAKREELHGFWSSVVFDEAEATNYRIAAAEKLHDRLYPAKDDGAEAGKIVIIGGLPDGD
jgi:hypothetical protein